MLVSRRGAAASRTICASCVSPVTITQYVVNYPGQFQYAIADQFRQKLLPELCGLMVDETK